MFILICFNLRWNVNVVEGRTQDDRAEGPCLYNLRWMIIIAKSVLGIRVFKKAPPQVTLSCLWYYTYAPQYSHECFCLLRAPPTYTSSG